MPQILVTTSTPLAYNIAAMQAQISAMVSSMSNGLPILASDVALLVSMYNDFVAHYHTATDLRGVDTFGNVGVYGTGGLYVTSTSSTAAGFAGATAPPAVTAGGEITASDINAIIGYINSMRIHGHTIDDITA